MPCPLLLRCAACTAHVWYDDKTFLAHGKGPESFDKTNPTFNMLRLCITLCNNAIFEPGTMDQEIIRRKTIGKLLVLKIRVV